MTRCRNSVPGLLFFAVSVIFCAVPNERQGFFAEALLARGSAKVRAGKAVFLEKFCYDFSRAGDIVGVWDIRIESSIPSAGYMELAVFDDQQSSYHDESEFYDFACLPEGGNGRLNHRARFDTMVNASRLPMVVTKGVQERVRPRWWFIALVECSGVDRVISYSIHLTNALQGSQRELSMDQCGLKTLGCIFVSYVTLLIIEANALFRWGSSARTKHPLRMLLFLAIAHATVGALLQWVYTMSLTRSGGTNVPIYVAGKAFKGLSKYTLMCMLVLFSRGHCISCSLRRQDVVRVAMLLTPVWFGCLCLEVWGEEAQSRMYTTGFVFLTSYGVLLAIADVGILLYYWWNLRRSHKQEIDIVKRHFYMTWGPLFSAAFLVTPAVMPIGAALSPWVRAAIVQVITNIVHTVLLALLVIGLWPEKTSPCLNMDEQELVTMYGIECSDEGGFNLMPDESYPPEVCR